MRYNGPRKVIKYTHCEEDSDTGEDDGRRGEYLGHKYKRAKLRELDVLKHTRLTPAPRMPEKADKTLTVGSSHFVHRSSVLRD